MNLKMTDVYSAVHVDWISLHSNYASRDSDASSLSYDAYMHRRGLTFRQGESCLKLVPCNAFCFSDAEIVM